MVDFAVSLGAGDGFVELDETQAFGLLQIYNDMNLSAEAGGEAFSLFLVHLEQVVRGIGSRWGDILFALV